MRQRVTPMPVDYETVGKFYETLSADLSSFVARVGEREAFCGDRNLQISRAEINFQGCDPVICAKTALAAFDAIVSQGEGATQEKVDSHYQRFIGIREELKALKAANPAFAPAYPAAVNPVATAGTARRRVWLEDETAATTVDVANSAYMLMLRLVSHSYLIPRPHPLKALCVDLSLGLMRAMAPLGDRAARLPAGPSNPGCNAGMSFTALRDSAPIPPGRSAGKFFVERFAELNAAAQSLVVENGLCSAWRRRRRSWPISCSAERGFAATSAELPRTSVATPSPAPAPAATANRADTRRQWDRTRQRRAHAAHRRRRRLHRGRDLTLIYEGRKCIHCASA
jgi:hypothetical protein